MNQKQECLAAGDRLQGLLQTCDARGCFTTLSAGLAKALGSGEAQVLQTLVKLVVSAAGRMGPHEVAPFDCLSYIIEDTAGPPLASSSEFSKSIWYLNDIHQLRASFTPDWLALHIWYSLPLSAGELSVI